MYSYIKGVITIIDTSYVVLENNGIGYMIYVANPYSYKENEEVIIYLYQQIREDENTLYGFKTKDDKDLFLKLISVKGLGCKMALPMLSGDNKDAILNNFEELTETLKSLGYKPNDIKKVLPKLDTSLSLEKQVKEALKLLLK